MPHLTNTAAAADCFKLKVEAVYMLWEEEVYGRTDGPTDKGSTRPPC